MKRAGRVSFCVILLLIFPCTAVHAFRCGHDLLLRHGGEEFVLTNGSTSTQGDHCMWHDTFYGLFSARTYHVAVNRGSVGMNLDAWYVDVTDNSWWDTACGRNYDYFQGHLASDVQDPTGSYALTEFYEGWGSCGAMNISIEIIPLDVIVEVLPEGAGTVEVTPSKEGYMIDDVVEAEAHPGADWVFDRWTTPLHSDSNPVSYTLYYYGTTFTANFKESQIRLGEGGHNPVDAYFNPFTGEREIVANHFTLTNKVDYGATVSELGFTVNGDLSLLAGVTLMGDDGCTGGGTEVATTNAVGGGTVTFSGLSETVPAGAERCYGLVLRFDTGVPIPFREEYTASISRGRVKATVQGDDADVSGDTVTGTVTSAGPKITLTALYDGSGIGDTRVGTFLSDIEVPNVLTAHVDMVPEDFADVDRVVFDAGGNVKEGTKAAGGPLYEAAYDMGGFQQTVPLTVTAHLDMNGVAMEAPEEFTLKALAVPGWFDVVAGISESFTKEFDGEAKAYEVGFSYPVDFVWKDAVPGNVGLLGGLGNDLGVEFSVAARYGIDETGSISGELTGTPSILGHEFELQGGLKGEFDADFAFTGGEGNLKAKVEFELPEKGYAKTFIVYGVPVTAAVDLGGSVALFVAGEAVLNRQLEFERASVSPGVTVTGVVTVSLSAVFGLAQVAATGEPSVTLEIQLVYSSSDGTDTTWTGEVVVPLTVVGSLFWGAADAELYSTELGPWNFGSGRTAMAIRPISLEGAAVPRLLSSYALAADGTGRELVLWIGDTSPGEAAPNPDVFFRFNDGSSWGAAAALIGPASPNGEWEMDPSVVFTGGDSALAAWTANDGAKSLDNLNDIFAAQDIAYAVWDGTGWSAPGRIIDDAQADGTATLAFDETGGRAVAVWMHDANQDRDIATRNEWTIMYAVFDPVEGVWTTPGAVGGTAADGADFMPAVAFDRSGSGLLVWARDVDGRFMEVLDQVSEGTNVSYGNADSDIMCAWWDGGGWGSPEAITTADGATDLAPAVAWAPSGAFVAVWVKKEGPRERLYCRVFRNGAWTEQVPVHEAATVEDPRVVVDADNRATLVWRGRSDLWSSHGALDGPGAPVWSEGVRLTLDDAVDRSPAMAPGDAGTVSLVWGKYDPVADEAGSGLGMSDGVYMGTAGSDAAAFTGVCGDDAVDGDENGFSDGLRVFVPVLVNAAGGYQVRADLYGGGSKIAGAGTPGVWLEPGTHTLTLVFPGSLIRDLGIDGPYEVKNLVILQGAAGGLVAAFDPGAYTTTAYEAAGFETGPLSLDREEYQGTDDHAVISLVSSAANANPGAADTVTVHASSSADTRGIGCTLTETGPDTGVFETVLGFDAFGSSRAGARVLVRGTSLVWVEYPDPALGYPWTVSCVWRPRTLGDVNMDLEVDVLDAVLVLQVLAGFEAEGTLAAYTEQGMALQGGTAVGLADVLYILQTAASIR